MFRLYDTLRREVVDIRTARRGDLRISACGPVDEHVHLGSMRTHMLTDLIRRNAERRGLSVQVCQTISEDAFRADSAALNIQPPDYSPRTSESIDLVIDMIAKLLEAGQAYVAANGSVYFDARTAPHLVLWTSAPAERELTWTAPWSTGRPAWPAGCAAVSMKFLGDLIDIRTGPIDLRFGHQEDERVLSNALAGHEVVQHWVDGGDTLLDDRRMAESTGNVLLVSDLARRGLDPLAARFAFLEHRYRESMNLTGETLVAADGNLRRWRELVADWADQPSKPMAAQYWSRITAALDDDLDTPAALRVLRDLANDDQVPAGARFETFASADRVLGLDLVSLVGRPRTVRP